MKNEYCEQADGNEEIDLHRRTPRIDLPLPQDPSSDRRARERGSVLWRSSNNRADSGSVQQATGKQPALTIRRDPAQPTG